MSIKILLKKSCPETYKICKKVYFFLREKLEVYIVGSWFQEQFWKRWRFRKDDPSGKFCEQILHPHRDFLVERISSYPWETLLEIGCNKGVNLYLLGRKFPERKLYGVDINSYSIEKGRNWFKKEQLLNVNLGIAKADNLSCFADKTIDLSLTNSTLIYVAPSRIKRVLREIIRITRKWVILFEWYPWDIEEGLRDAWYFDGVWIYDYKKILNDCLGVKEVVVNRLPPGLWNIESWKRFGCYVEVKL